MGDTLRLRPRLRTASRRALAIRGAKVRLLGLARLAAWAVRPGDFPRPRLAPAVEAFPVLAYQRVHPVSPPAAGFHPQLEAGKRRNLALAAPAFDGLLVTPDRPLSFWRALGRLTPELGYVPGASYADGCVVPAVGGGICLLSNALFAMASALGWTILERHGHTLDAAPAASGPDPWGLDATVLWPYVDLRVAPREGAARLEVEVRGGALHVRARTEARTRARVVLQVVDDRRSRLGAVEIRENRIVRRLESDDLAAVTTEIIAENRKELRAPERAGRSCLDCGQTDCPMGERARATEVR